MKNPFKNQQGQVRWGYKFFSLILIWDMVIPVIILGIALAFTLAFRILLMNMGIMDGDGVLMESYRGQADNWYMVYPDVYPEPGHHIPALCPVEMGVPFILEKSWHTWQDMAEGYGQRPSPWRCHDYIGCRGNLPDRQCVHGFWERWF